MKEFGTSGYMSIEKQIKPLLIKAYDNITAFNSSKCNNIGGCPVWWKSSSELTPNFEHHW